MKQVILRFPEVQKRTGLSRSTVWRLERAGKFPQRVRVGLRGVGWFESSINDYISESKPVQLGEVVE